jgi:hypothetical protein
MVRNSTVVALNNARYRYGLPAMLIVALNDDMTAPSPTRIVGGAGPFDFSGASVAAAVPISIRLDTNAVETFNLNMTVGIANISAVTVAELFGKINAAGFTDITASQEAVTNRLKIEYTGTGLVTFMQAYGEAARLGMIGQGKGCKFVTIDTAETLETTPTIKDGEERTMISANDDEQTMKLGNKQTGWEGTYTDQATDLALREILSGGTYNTTTGDYDAPLQTDPQIYFYMIAFQAEYEPGINVKGDLVRYIQSNFWKGGAKEGAAKKGGDWDKPTYALKGYEPRVWSVGTGKYVASPNHGEVSLTIPEYQALNVTAL